MQVHEFSGLDPQCPVARCSNTRNFPTEWCCSGCWSRLPEGAQRAVFYALAQIGNRDLPYRRKEECREVLWQARARLIAELAEPLSLKEMVEADALTRELTAFTSLAAMLDAPGYYPKLECSRRAHDSPLAWNKHCRLADLYDRSQRERGDDRRCVRLGVSGL